MRLAEQDQPQRRGVDAAVVGVVGRLTAARHLAAAQLVEDLAGLRVMPRIVGRRLQTGQHRQRVDRERRHERHGLERRDDAVAPEQRREPGDPGGQVALALGRPVVAEHGEVGQRSGEGPVEQLVVRIDAGDLGAGGPPRRRWRPASPVTPGARHRPTSSPPSRRSAARSVRAAPTTCATTLAPGRSSPSGTGSSRPPPSMTTVVVRRTLSRPS